MKSDSYKLSLRFEQLLELVRQLSPEEQSKLYKELKTSGTDTSDEVIAKRQTININGVTVYKGDPKIDTQELEEIFSKNAVDFRKLREKAWNRK